MRFSLIPLLIICSCFNIVFADDTQKDPSGVLFSAVAVKAPENTADRIRAALDFAENLLQQRVEAFEFLDQINHSAYSEAFGTEGAQKGIFWVRTAGNASSSYVASHSKVSDFVLRHSQSTERYERGDSWFQLDEIQWDRENQMYTGEGTVFESENVKCGIIPLPARVRIEIEREHPFMGAWKKIDIYYPKPISSENCTDVVLEDTHIYLERQYLAIELFPAIDQARDFLSETMEFLQDEIQDLRVSVASGKKSKYVRSDAKKRLDQIHNALNGLRLSLSSLEAGLIKGGKVRLPGIDVPFETKAHHAFDVADPKLQEMVGKIYRNSLYFSLRNKK